MKKSLTSVIIFILLIVFSIIGARAQDIVKINFEGNIYPITDTACIKLLVVKNKCLNVNRKRKFISVSRKDTIIYMNGKYYYNFEPNWIILK